MPKLIIPACEAPDSMTIVVEVVDDQVVELRVSHAATPGASFTYRHVKEDGAGNALFVGSPPRPVVDDIPPQVAAFVAWCARKIEERVTAKGVATVKPKGADPS